MPRGYTVMVGGPLRRPWYVDASPGLDLRLTSLYRLFSVWLRYWSRYDKYRS